ncbi:hypothetical protein SH449x_005214 [Pirellulaceae bacterium SH449]
MPPSVLLRVLADIYDLAEQLGANPVVAGGLAVSYWGHPRSTQDIDLAVIVSDEPSFFSNLTASNLTLSKSGRVIDLGFVRVSQWTRAVEDAYIDCEIDFLLSSSSYHQEAIHRSVLCDFPGIAKSVRVLSCEDLLLFKAASGRLIDLADIQTLYSMHRTSLDHDYLAEKAQELQLPARFWLRV